MSSIFYMDYENGIDSGGVSTNTPLGWWSVTFNGGSGNAPTADDAITGATSGHHGHLTVVGTLTSGSWAGNDAAGTMYFYGMDDLLHNGEQIDWHDGHAHTTAAAVYNPWKTITSGATAARIAPGDTVRIAKSPAPTTIGDATWTNLSNTVTLAAAQTANVDLCETAWTPAAGTDVTVVRTAVASDGKEGSYCMKFTTDAATQANILQAYFPTGALDLSLYQKLSFWFKNEVAIADATTWEIALCTGADGTGVVDSFPIPAIPSTARWLPLTIAKVGGGNLSNNVNSIALLSKATAPTASKYIFVDDFIACTTDGLNLQSLISKNSLEQGGTEGWYGIQSINDVTVMLDNETNTKSGASRGYSTLGATPETVATYKRETIKTSLAAAQATLVQEIKDSGSLAAGNIIYQGGYSSITNGLSGETFFDGLNGWGTGLNAANTMNFYTVAHISFCRYYTGVQDAYGATMLARKYNNMFFGNCYNLFKVGLCFKGEITDIIAVNGVYGPALTVINSTITNVIGNNNLNDGISTVGGALGSLFQNVTALNNGTYGFLPPASPEKLIVYNFTTADNVSAAVKSFNFASCILINAAISEASVVGTFTNYSDARLLINRFNANSLDNRIYTDNGTIVSQIVTRHTASGAAWKFSPAALRTVWHKLDLPIARIACTGGKAVTFKAWMKKDHATDVACWLRVVGGQDPNIPTDVTVTKADDTDWEELTLPSFTPTNACVIEVLAEAWYVAGVSYAYIDDITISEAA